MRTPTVRATRRTVERLDEIPGIGPNAAQVILAEIGLDMSRFPTAAHLVSWAKLCPRTIQSGPVTRGGKTGKGNPYLKGALGDAAAAAAKTNTFLGERYRRIVKRRGKLKALVAVARSILVIVWHLLDRPRRPLPRPRLRLPRPPHRHRTPNAQPHRPTDRDGLPRHPRTRRLTQIHTGTTRPGSTSSAGCLRLPTQRRLFFRSDKRGRSDPVSPSSQPGKPPLDTGRKLVILMTMPEVSSLAEAKAHLSELVARVSDQHERITVTVHGRPTAVLLAVDDLESLEETIAVLSDPAALRALGEADAELARGEGENQDSLAAAMQARRAKT